MGKQNSVTFLITYVFLCPPLPTLNSRTPTGPSRTPRVRVSHVGNLCPRSVIRRNCFHLRPSSGQLEYDLDDTTRELPDFPRGSSPVPFPDEMRSSKSIPLFSNNAVNI
ncbi:hypothetical protein AVEN_111113-1 [Araneus ventricosus]|uniref:Uncharacterized protein n=1 Tax=Araneus ventricosus TaxID=182803 RepID=A0A4Y2DMB1_ARAVE|nr:hypothetical protein AVEN_111113-1 [Araneus ventricosus]